jgi:hypothetical protein
LVLVSLLVFGLAFPAAGGPKEARDGEAKGKPFVFPAGKFILGGGSRAATGQDVYEFKKPFTLRPGQFILCGGPSPTTPIVVDDDLEVLVDGQALFVDDDHVASTDTRPAFPRSYDGTPIILVLDPAKKLRIRAIDHVPSEAILGELYLYRHDGARKRLTGRIAENSNPNLPHVFFDQEFSLDGDFEAPPSDKDAIQVPAVPADLLRHEKSAGAAPERKN